jgi:microcystin degradation protein MlrC
MGGLSNPRRPRIAVGGISLESNDFVPFTGELDDFTGAGFMLEHADVFSLRGTDTELAGALDVLEDAGAEVVPLLAARGVSSGRLSTTAYGRLRGGLLEALAQSLPVDGVFLFQHGSMEAVGEDDPEGDVAAAVRAAVGGSPVAMTCDLHGNVTRRMVGSLDVLVGYRHYPHDDARETGRRAARLLLQAVAGEIQPVIAHAKLPLILTAFNSTTLTDTPYARLLAEAAALEERKGILSASVFLVGSYIDAPDMGCSALVVADGNVDLAVQEARRLAQRFWDGRRLYEVETVSVAEAVRHGRAIAGGPVLLLDTADTTGGGAAGDGIGLVRGLLDAGVEEPCLAQVVDPAAAAACHAAGEGAELRLAVGHGRDPRWGTPLELEGTVSRLLDGRFRYAGGILGGVEVSMGPSAVIGAGSVSLLVMSQPTYDWADDQYLAAGLDPAQAKFIGVKNMMNFRFGYGDVMKGFFVLDLPGPTPPDLRSLPFARITRPVFPLDRELEQPVIAVATSTRAEGGP